MLRKIVFVFAWSTHMFTMPVHAAKVCAESSKELDAKLFMRSDCATCLEAMRFLYREGIPFREFDAENLDIQKRLLDGAGAGRVPALHICGEWFFGFEEDTKHRILRLFPHQA